MTYRVIQWATGLVGQEAIKGIVAHPELELVGCWVHSDAKVGLDAGEIAGIGPLGVLATNSLAEICAINADAVVYSPMLADEGEILALLGSGKNVITPIGYIFPRANARTAEVEAACVAANVTLHGTGEHPGGITERFPLTFSAFCRNIRHVRMEEFSDIRNYAATSMVRDVMLFGQTPEVAAKSPMLKVMASGFLQSIDMVAHELGWTLDPKKRTKHEMSVATRPIDSPVGVIEPGTVAAQRFTWQGTVNDEPVITVRTNWMMDDGHLSDGWKLGEQRFECEIEGDSPEPLLVTFHGLHPPVLGEDSWVGLIAPAMHCVNSIPYVVNAEPGIKTYLDLPLIAGRAAQS
jgi:2,4-diaminopentanoate dehydrogenase